MPAFLAPLLAFLQPVLDRILPDKAQQDEFKNQLALGAQAADGQQLQAALQLALAQADVDKVEAASTDWFERDWRSAVGWICALALACNFFVVPLLTWGCANFHWIAPPKFDIADVMALLVPLLGMAASKNFDNQAGK